MNGSRETGRAASIEAVIRQAGALAGPDWPGEAELSEEQLDLVAAAVTAPEYRRFIQSVWERRRAADGA